MNDHLSPEQLKMFLEGRLKGRERIDALLHMEECTECIENLPNLSKDELLERILKEEENIEDKLDHPQDPDPESQKRSFLQRLKGFISR